MLAIPSGAGEGQIFLGSTSATTDGGGSANFTMTFGTGVPSSQTVTATATDPGNNTSAFAQCKQVSTGNLKISGRIVDDSAGSLAGVAVLLSGDASGSATTDGAGNYSFTNLGAGNYTVTPSSSNHSFSPASHTFNNLSVDRIANFVATQTLVSISGKVTDAANAGVGSVTVALTKDGLPNGTTLTNGLGDYSFVNRAAGSTYSVTPAGSFSPSSQSFNSLTVNAVANFIAAASIPPQCNTPSFGAATNFAVGSCPRDPSRLATSTAMARTDLAVANVSSNNVSILLGHGHGQLRRGDQLRRGGASRVRRGRATSMATASLIWR